MAAAPWIVSDELWELVEPLLPRKERRSRYPGRKRLPDRQALQGILFEESNDARPGFLDIFRLFRRAGRSRHTCGRSPRASADVPRRSVGPSPWSRGARR